MPSLRVGTIEKNPTIEPLVSELDSVLKHSGFWTGREGSDLAPFELCGDPGDDYRQPVLRLLLRLSMYLSLVHR
jgi:hypothetical protein